MSTSESPNSTAAPLSLKTSSLGQGSLDPKEKAILVESAAKLQPIIKVDVVPENGDVQQDVVDMYMKSMQQFIESLAKMKLSMDLDVRTNHTRVVSIHSANTHRSKHERIKKRIHLISYTSHSLFSPNIHRFISRKTTNETNQQKLTTHGTHVCLLLASTPL